MNAAAAESKLLAQALADVYALVRHHRACAAVPLLYRRQAHMCCDLA